MELFQERAGVQPPAVAPIDGRFRTGLHQHLHARRRGRWLGHRLPGGDPAGDDQPLVEEGRRRPGQPVRGGRGVRARASSGDHGAQWVTLVRRTSQHGADLDLVGAMDAGRETSARWAAGQLVGTEKRKGRSVVEFPSAQEMVVRTSAGAVRPEGRAADRTRAPSAWSARPRNRRSTPPGARTSPTPRAPRSSSRPPPALRARLDATLRARRVEQGRDQRHVDEAARTVGSIRGRRGRRAPDRERRAGAGRGAGRRPPVTDRDRPAILRRHQDEILEAWKNPDLAEPTRLLPTV